MRFKKTWHIVLLTGLISITLGACTPSENDQQALAKIHLDQAQAYYSAGQFRAAMIEARNVIQKSPNAVAGYVIRAKILNTLGQYQQAIDLLEPLPQTIEVNADFEQVLVEAYIGKRKFHSALSTLEKATQLKQSNAKKFNLLRAESLRETGSQNKALALYQSVLSNYPNDAEALIGIALINVYQDNLAEAIKHLQTAIAENPGHIKASLILAQIHYQQKKYNDAETLLTDILLNLPDTDTVSPEKAATLNLLADVLVLQGRTAEAMIYTQKLADAFPGYDLAAAAYEEAEQLAKDGQLTQAAASLEQLLEDNPGFSRASTLLAVVKYMQGDFATASSFLSQNFDAETAHPDLTKIAVLSHLKSQNSDNVIAVLKNYPGLNDDSNLLSIYGAALLDKEQFDESLTALTRAIEINPQSTFAYLSLASYYNLHQKTEKALQSLQTAYKFDPQDPLIVINLAKQYMDAGEKAKADQLIHQNIELSKQSSPSLEMAGDFYQHLNEHNKSLTFYQQALNADKNNFAAAIKLARALEELNSPFNKIITAYNFASKIEPETPLTYEYILRYANTPELIDQGIESVAEIADSNNSSIGHAVLTLYLAGKGKVSQAQLYRNKIDPEKITPKALNRVDELLLTAHALSALHSNDTVKAREHAHNGLKIAPQSIRLMKIIADIELSQANYREAEKIITQITSVNQPLGFQLLGDMHQKQGHIPEALSAYNSAWHLQPDEKLGAKIYHLMANESSEQQQFFSDWSKIFPNSIYITEINSRQLIAAQQYQKAIPLMEAIRQTKPENAENLNNLAWSYFKTGHSDALSTAQTAYQLEPEHAAIVDTYGWIMYKLGDSQAAISLLEKAVALAPEEKEISKHLAQARAGQ